MSTKVFISSTSKDLAEYRSIAIDVCLEFDLAPIAMEFFEAMDSGSTLNSKLKVATADIYLGIFAHRYGFIEQGYEKSVTQIEYENARDLGLSRLCFISTPQLLAAPSDVDERDKLEPFEKQIQQEITGSFTDPNDFGQKLAIALANWKSLHMRREKKRITLTLGKNSNEFKTEKFIELVSKLANLEISDFEIISIEEG